MIKKKQIKTMNELLEEMLSVFQIEIKTIFNKFQDKRKFIFKESNNEIFCFSLDHYDLNEIEIHYNRNRIIREYLEDSDRTGEELVETFKYLARHEYCHKLISETSQNLNSFEKDQDEEINKIEKFNYIRMENKFREYFSDYKVNQFFNKIPKNYIESVLVMLKNKKTLKHHCYGMLPVRNDNSRTKDQLKIYSYLQNLYRFHICDCWDLLKPIFNSINRGTLLKFFLLLFHSFQDIVNEYDTLHQIRDSVIKLIKFLDQCPFEDLIFKNTLSKEIEEGLTNLNFESVR